MAARRKSPKTPPSSNPTLPDNAAEAMLVVFSAHQASQRAFAELLGTGADDTARLQRHRDYRECTTRLLHLLHAHNESGLAPSPWDTTLVAEPLAQQALIEADLLDAGGDAADAAQLRTWVLELATTELPPVRLARVHRSLANQSAADGRFNEALSAFADLRQVFTDLGEVTDAVQTTLDAVALLEWLGDYDRALASLEEAKRLLPPVATPPASMIGAPGSSFDNELARLRAQLEAGLNVGAAGAVVQQAGMSRVSIELVEKEARLRKARGEYQQAAALWESVVPYYVSIGGAEAVDYQLAAVDRLLGKPAKARERLARIEPSFSSGLLGGKVAGLRQMQSWVELDLGNAARALALANQGLAALENNPDEDLAWRLHWRKAAALRALGRQSDAIAAYLEAAVSVDSLRKAPLGYRLDSTSLEIRLPLIEEGIALAAGEGDGRSCLRLIEVVKARALSSALSVPANARAERTDLEREFDDVTQRLDALEYRRLRGIAVDDAPAQRRALLRQRIALVEQIRLRDPRWRGLTAPAPFDPSALAAALARRGQAALTLYLTGNVVRAVLIVDGRFEVGEQPVSREALDALQSCEEDLGPRGTFAGLGPEAYGLDAAMFVPGPLLEKALSRNSLLIAPHRRLHLLPWASMPFRGMRLFERLPVGILPNLTCALTLEAEHAAAPRAALVGVAAYPGLPRLVELPAAGREIDALASLYADRLVAPVLRDGAATEAAVRALASRDDTASAILHLACHGTLDAQDPLGAAVLMADGRIDAAEWAQLHLQYEEVVLSACSTGWRPLDIRGDKDARTSTLQLRGDDVLGLPGALLEAGARAIVVSIPKASDTGTEAFMTAYHRRRAAGTPPLPAFCQTQRELLAGALPPETWMGIVCYAVQ